MLEGQSLTTHPIALRHPTFPYAVAEQSGGSFATLLYSSTQFDGSTRPSKESQPRPANILQAQLAAIATVDDRKQIAKDSRRRPHPTQMLMLPQSHTSVPVERSAGCESSLKW